MSQLDAELCSIQSISGAGRGVIAIKRIPKGTLLLQSARPAAHVVQWEYRKEVCAQCFHYNLGRALPIRPASTGNAFCSTECYDQWLHDQGEIGVTAFPKLYAFISSKANAITNAHGIPGLCEKPDANAIDAQWTKAGITVDQWRLRNSSSVNGRRRKKTPPIPVDVIDPYVLPYLLSGVLSIFKHPEIWNDDILPLAMDSTPYQSPNDLEAHCRSFIQLAFLLPDELQPILTAETCRTLISAAGHNSFGIRFGTDGEEYVGYGLYPEASYFNHSCDPNIAKKRIGAAWEFTASREIQAGEECCITYLGGDEKTLTVLARRSRLQAHWGFECMCRRCVEESRPDDVPG